MGKGPRNVVVGWRWSKWTVGKERILILLSGEVEEMGVAEVGIRTVVAIAEAVADAAMEVVAVAADVARATTMTPIMAETKMVVMVDDATQTATVTTTSMRGTVTTTRQEVGFVRSVLQGILPE